MCSDTNAGNFFTYACVNCTLSMQEKEDKDFVKSLFRLSDESGSMEFSLVSEGSFSRSMLDPKDGMCIYIYMVLKVSVCCSRTLYYFHLACPLK